ncbi:MAG: MFS transporter [Acidobacteriota bacterium]|nr:MFS transporter [Acidobacteriota bacterium]
MAVRFLFILDLEMLSVAVGWQIYEITRRALDLGLAGLAVFLPGLLLFLVGGHVSDRFNRRSVLLVCFTAFTLCAVLLLAFTLRGLHSVLPIYAVLLATGVIRVFSSPAMQAFMPLLVTTEQFPAAAAWSGTTLKIGSILGPVLGGILYALRDNPIPVYLAAALGLGLTVLMLSFIRVGGVQQISNGRDWHTMLAGLSYVWRNKMILGATSMDLFAVLLGGAVALLPIFAREILHSGPRGLGLLRAAPGAGAAMVALWLAWRPLHRRAGLKMMTAVSLFGLATIVFGLSRNLWLSALALFIVGAADMISVIVRSTLVQLATPDEMRGRVSAVNVLFIGTSNEFGEFESGVTAHWFGAVPAVVLGGLGTLAVVGIWSWLFPVLRNVDRLTDESLAVAAAEEEIADAR